MTPGLVLVSGALEDGRSAEQPDLVLLPHPVPQLTSPPVIPQFCPGPGLSRTAVLPQCHLGQRYPGWLLTAVHLCLHGLSGYA